MKITLPRFEKARVLIAGDVMLDRYWHGGTSRISPEAPVPVVKVGQIEDRAGGAANSGPITLNRKCAHRSSPPDTSRPFGIASLLSGPFRGPCSSRCRYLYNAPNTVSPGIFCG